MTDQEIRQSWLDYYAKWRNDREASQIVHQICALIVQRAKASTILGTAENQIMYLCFEIGIPKSEFEEVRG